MVRPEEAALLDRRTEVRASYRALVTQAGGWALPPAIRVALDRWQFDAAADLIAKTSAVLAARPALEAAARAVGVQLADDAPDDLRGRRGTGRRRDRAGGRGGGDRPPRRRHRDATGGSRARSSGSA